jgi:hypothetical protein
MAATRLLHNKQPVSSLLPSIVAAAAIPASAAAAYTHSKWLASVHGLQGCHPQTILLNFASIS